MDNKREDFRRYMEKTGVMDTLTKVLVALYEEPEKPSDALSYLKSHLSIAHPDQAELESLREELAAAKQQIETYKQENQKLKADLEKYLAVESLSKEETAEPELKSDVAENEATPEATE